MLLVGGVTLVVLPEAISNSTGAPAGRSGGPSVSGATCAAVGCHSGPAASSQTISVSTDIPASGFVENTSYTITVTANTGGASHPAIGFQASIENASGTHQGTISAGSGSQLVGVGGKYITHTTGGGVSGGMKSWTFTWNSGTAENNSTLYMAANFANGNGNTTGDVIITDTEVFTKASGIGLEEAVRPEIRLFPNPAIDRARLEVKGGNGKPAADLLDLNGRFLTMAAEVSPTEVEFDLSEVPAGVYLVHWSKGSASGTERLTVQ